MRDIDRRETPDASSLEGHTMPGGDLQRKAEEISKLTRDSLDGGGFAKLKRAAGLYKNLSEQLGSEPGDDALKLMQQLGLNIVLGISIYQQRQGAAVSKDILEVQRMLASTKLAGK